MYKKEFQLLKEQCTCIDNPTTIYDENALIVRTLCDDVKIYNCVDEVNCPICSSCFNVVRIIDSRMSVEDELYDEDSLSIEDFGEPGEFPDYFEKEEVYFQNIYELGRNFLSTTDFSNCHNFLLNWKRGSEYTITENLLSVFSMSEQKNLLTDNIKRKKITNYKLRPIESKGKFATSFFKGYKGSEEVSFSVEEICAYLIDRGLRESHLGFAIGNIDDKIGAVEIDGYNNVDKDTKKMVHVSFWKYRWSLKYHELAENFNYYSFNL